VAFLTDELIDRPAVRTRCYLVYCSAERVVMIPRGRYWNLCLRDIYEEVCGSAGSDDRVWFQIALGAVIGSRRTKEAALRRGWWPGEHVEPSDASPPALPFAWNAMAVAVVGLPWL
jgi:hypothetical protein